LNLPDECIKDIADVITADVGQGEDVKELEGEAGDPENDDFAGAAGAQGDDMITF